MLLEILRFELRYWLRSMMVWVFFLIVAFMIGGALSTDNIQVGGALSNTFKNAPFVIENYYAIMAILTLLMTTAFVNSAAARDFTANTYQMIFTTPIRRWDFLVGRYLGAAFVSVIPMLGISAAVLTVKYMPWIDADRWGPVRWDAHFWAIVAFAIPNTLFIAAIIFAIAALTRSTVTSFLGGLLLIVAYGVSQALLSNLDNERIAMLLDPFGVRTFGLITKYWTVAEKNNLTLPLTGYLLLNRLIWLSVGTAVFVFAGLRFSFSERSKKLKKVKEADTSGVVPAIVNPRYEFGWAAQLAQFMGATRTEFFGLVKSISFIVIGVATLLNCIPTLALSASEGYGNSTYPVTYWILELIQGTMYVFLIGMITYYAGVLVWRERDAHMDEIHDALPHPSWINYLSKLAALIGMVVVILAIAMVSGIAVQAWHGYHRFQIGLYLSELFFVDLSIFVLLAVLAFFIHVLAPNKYVGYFIFVTYLIASSFVWPALNVASNMVDYASRPSMTYSDLFGREPFWKAWGWFTAYWGFFAALLAAVSIALWQRGKESSLLVRARYALARGIGPVGFAGACFLLTGGWVFYNTKIENKLEGPKDRQRRQADYEKTYKKLAKVVQPRVTALRFRIDLDPPRRAMTLKSDSTIVNKSDKPIAELYFTVDEAFDHEIEVDGAKRKSFDERLRVMTFEFTPPLEPGATRVMHLTTKTRNRGFENTVSNLQIVQNGTFFNNSIVPQIGYQDGVELNDRNDRKKYGLGEKEQMPPLERNCTADCMNTYLGKQSDWVSVESVISTSPDQIAIAPGSLVKEWTADGRRYFEYKLDHDSMNFYSFLSARYAVAREDWNGVKIEVYYHPEHVWNVTKMSKSIRKSLEYCSANFGPYKHHEARIIEFPRVAGFAQAFPGTMPYSESIGFIANLTHPDDIDMVYYVVAHEMAHQWWAHQVVGANMEGATLLSETMAQYSALMIMEHEYGRDKMRKFLKYEMDNYLRNRGRERLKEQPLLHVEANQGYVHYRKGSVVMYMLKEVIGEDAINRALRRMVERYAYKEPPYPTSHDLVDLLAAETPAQYQYLIKDLFEDITLFSNRTLEATAKKRADGKYDVSIDVESKKFKAGDKGAETEVKLDDWIEIGAFAKPEKDKKYGKTLYRDRVHITDARKTYTFVVDELPEKAGIDPFLLLVDRVPDDNTKKVTVN